MGPATSRPYVAEAADRAQARAEMTEVLNRLIDG